MASSIFQRFMCLPCWAPDGVGAGDEGAAPGADATAAAGSATAPEGGQGAESGESAGTEGGQVPADSSTQQDEAPAAAPAEDEAVAKWRKDQFQRRIDRLTALNKRLAEEKEALVRSQQTDTQADRPDVETLAQRRAAEILAKQTFDNNCIEAVNRGRETFGAEEFDRRTATLREVVTPGDATAEQQYVGLLNAMIETGEAEKLIYVLGGDPAEAERLMGLSPVKQGIELARLAAKDVQPASKLAKPITPVTGAGRSHVAIAPSDRERADNLSTAEWMERRNAEIKAVNERAGRRVL